MRMWDRDPRTGQAGKSKLVQKHSLNFNVKQAGTQ